MIADLPKSEALIDIAKEIQETKFGDVNVTVTTFMGNPVGLVITSYRHEKFNENSKALESLLTVFKTMVDQKETGSLTFTVVFNQGQAKEVIQQLYDKKSYQTQKVDTTKII